MVVLKAGVSAHQVPETVGEAANIQDSMAPETGEDMGRRNKKWQPPKNQYERNTSKGISSISHVPIVPKVIQPEISVEDRLSMWSYLTDVQFGKFDPNALEKMNTWIITGDGKWLVQKNEAGYFGVKKSDEGIDTLPKDTITDEAFISLKYGKIPQGILDQILTFFRTIMKRHSGAEGFLQVYWDLEQDKYIIHVPKQVVSGASVRYDKTKDLDKINAERYVFVYECHSHNNMPAFWSGTDNADENDLRVFGVFGKLGQDKYQNEHRCFVGEEEISLQLDTVFEQVVAESEYQVTLATGELVTVKRSDIAMDDTPRFMVQPENSEEVHTVKKEDIKKINRVTAIPEEWFAEINTQAARSQIQNVWSGQNKPWKNNSKNTSYSTSPYIKKGEEKEDEAEVTRDEEAKIERVVTVMADLTSDFESLPMTEAFCQELDYRNLLEPLRDTLLAFSGDYDGNIADSTDDADEINDYAIREASDIPNWRDEGPLERAG